MTRRELLRLGGSSLLFASLAPTGSLGAIGVQPSVHSGGRRLFFSADDLPLIRANAKSPLLQPLYQKWKASPPSALGEALDTFEASGNIIRDFLAVLMELSHSATVQLVEPAPQREAAIIDAIKRVIARPHWDHFRDGDSEVIGIQRSSLATVNLLYAREVLGDALDSELDQQLLTAIAEKGCLSCARTIDDMEHPEMAHGWDFDEVHAGFYDITMERWPTILGANNLRAAPTGALGLGALALHGQDPRADEWLAMATASADRFLKLISPDGTYFEGISYLSYSLRTTLPFIDAHRRLIGDVDWAKKVNWDGVLDHIMIMQLGRKDDGRPDIVNFSDARESVFPGGISRLALYSQNPIAGYAAKHAGAPGSFLDFLWYRPDAPVQPPRAALRNARTDLNWVICRSGWQPDDAVVAFRSGAPANHEHADRNHITFKAFGERLLNDHFGASYDRREPGWKMRLTRAHNAVLIDGQGHTYVDGMEGTNDSKAYATILQYEDHGEHVWWTSDASAAYLLDNYHLQQVLRTVLFIKPGVLIVTDQIRFRYRPQTVDARFFPDNADGKARLAVDGERFTLSRPKAQLHGMIASDTEATPRLARLEVPEEVGDFPCVEVHSPEALDHHIITVLAVTPGSDSAGPELAIDQAGDKWNVTAGDHRAAITMSAHAPAIRIL